MVKLGERFWFMFYFVLNGLNIFLITKYIFSEDYSLIFKGTGLIAQASLGLFLTNQMKEVKG